MAELIDAALHRRSLLRWRRAARGAPSAELGQLRRDQARARALRLHLDELLVTAESRLALPRIGSQAFPRPPGTDWSWRPRLWRGALAQKGLVAVGSPTPMGEEATIFHDCRISELTLRQVRNGREGDLSPFGLRMEVFRFDGSFLSLALEAPRQACEGLRRRHLVRLDAVVEIEKPIDIFVRLNIRHGPNTEEMVLKLPLDRGADQGGAMVEFDLAYSSLNERRVEQMWIDLIFERPAMNQITLRDLTLARYPRAEL